MLEVKQRRPAKPDDAIPPAGLSIAEAARRTGVSVHTLRYYERAGRWRYHQQDLYWIKICTKLRATGMPIKTIRRYAELVAAGPGNEHERLALLESHRAQVVAKLAELQENLKIIDHKIDVYRNSVAAGEADQLWAPTA